MSTEQNKSIVRRWVEEGWNKGNLATVDQVYGPGYAQHESEPQQVNSAEALKAYVAGYRGAFPDLHFTVDDLIAEGDKVVWRFTSTGTHNGPLMGIPASGKRASLAGIVIFRFEASRIVEGWVNFDTLGLMQAIGVIPALA